MNIEKEAVENIAALKDNPYPGRGLVIGRTDEFHVAQVYWLMGRSENSRNRRLVHEGDVVKTVPVDLKKVTDPSLIIYNAMREEGQFRYVVSNGDHTDTVFSMSEHKGGDFRDAMREREFEPDDPNYTPRIAAAYTRYTPGYGPVAEIAILSRSHDNRCVRTFYEYHELPIGFGYCVHTYLGDGTPLPAFNRAPYLVHFGQTYRAGKIAEFFWDLLNKENRIALATKIIDIESGKSEVHIINRY